MNVPALLDLDCNHGCVTKLAPKSENGDQSRPCKKTEFQKTPIYLVLSKLLSTISSSLNSLVDNLLQSRILKAHKSSVGGAVGAGDVLSQLRWLLGRLNKHLAGAEAGLLSKASGLLLGKTKADTAGDEMLDKGEEQSRRQILLSIGHILSSEKSRSALSDQSRRVGHDANNSRRLATIALEPLRDASKGNASSDGDNDRQTIPSGPRSAELLAHALGNLGLDSEDDDVGISSGLLVVGGGFGDVDVLLGDVLCEETTDDGSGHVAAAEEGDLCVL
ncbi:hypothetical protein HG530_001290 [Fusarium avenaceum]|nr:hypothetical protein HG530_001290 [Fusarium avenaceum]